VLQVTRDHEHTLLLLGVLSVLPSDFGVWGSYTHHTMVLTRHFYLSLALEPLIHNLF